MNKLLFLKNYIYIFVIHYLIILLTKFIFTYYLYENFSALPFERIIYAIFWGVKFDLALAAVATLLVTFFDFHKKSFIFITLLMINFIFLSQISDVFYFYESSRHMGYEIADALTDASGLLMTAISQHTVLSLLSLLFTLLLSLFLYSYLQKKLNLISIKKFYFLQKFILLFITVFFVRGMTQNIPLNPWQSNQIGEQKLSSLALNGSYNAIYALINKSKKLKPLELPSLDENIIEQNIQEIYSSKHTKYSTNLKDPNIVFFFLESWSAVNMKSYGFEKATTPFYDEILKKSIRPKAMIAGGHRTTEGIFATLASYQNPLGKTISKTQLQDFYYTSIIDILNTKGYSSAFFQGSSKETSGTGSFVQDLGFQQSYGKHDVTERDYETNYWGVHDPDMYNFAVKKLSKMKEPFTIGLNGATTHDDKIPEGIKAQKFSTNNELNKQLNALHFSDAALKEFVTKIEKLYPNTLFVFVADHCGGVKGSSFQNYMIPFAVYSKNISAKYYDTYLSQRDITPTVLDLAFGDYRQFSSNFTGKSLLSDVGFGADYFHSGYLGWIEDNKAIEINIATNTYNCYDVSNFDTESTLCTDDIIHLKNKALSFTHISQKLLFEGKTDTFKDHKNAQ
ncbi:MAG: sulfatase-like hydrolase/transferase [Arcobacteraceae bacterium]